MFSRCLAIDSMQITISFFTVAILPAFLSLSEVSRKYTVYGKKGATRCLDSASYTALTATAVKWLIVTSETELSKFFEPYTIAEHTTMTTRIEVINRNLAFGLNLTLYVEFNVCVPARLRVT